MQMADVDLVFQKTRVGARAGKHGATDIGILAGTMLVRVANPELVSVGKVVKHAAGTKKMSRGIGDRLGNRAKAERLRGGNSARIDDALQIQNIVVERQQKAGVLAVTDRPGHRALVILATLRRLYDREGIARVKDGIAKHEIQLA